MEKFDFEILNYHEGRKDKDGKVGGKKEKNETWIGKKIEK